MRADSDARGRPPIALARDGRSRAPMNNTASFLDNHITRGSHLCPLARPITRYRRPVTIWEHVHTHRSRLGRGRACTSVRLWEYGWEDLRDSCAVFLVFRVGSARTLTWKGPPPTAGADHHSSHRGGHTMENSSLSDESVAEKENRLFRLECGWRHLGLLR